jgi:uncharacterized protein (DUF362 family)
MPDRLVVHGVARGASAREASATVRRVFERATNGCPWLRPNDTVLLKVALNSQDPYPSTTSPIAVQAVAEALQERGARVIIGDMPGVEHVLLTPKGSLKRSSRYCYEQSGMGAGTSAAFVGFEERGWDEGFFHFQDPAASSWPNGFHVTRQIQEVDHVIALPRLSTHTQGGVTLGMKLAVGYLRTDSRMAFHCDGPFYTSMKAFVAGTGLTKNLVSHGRFFEKITEVNLAVLSRQRLTLCVGTEAQVTFGPDRQVPIAGLRACHVVPETGLVFASTNAVAVEVLGLAYLTLLYQDAPWYRRFLQRMVMLLNWQAPGLGEDSVWNHPFVRHALQIGLGERAFELECTDVPDALLTGLQRVMAHDPSRT